MSAYEEILDIMRNQGKKDNASPIQIGVMESENVCTIGKLKLSGEDLLVVENLKTGYHHAVDNKTPSERNKNTFTEGLRKGDRVAIYRISDELYIILGRLVPL